MVKKSKNETNAPDSEAEAEGSPPVTIRKYANRRLYNTATREFVTLDDLRQYVTDGVAFVVIDAKTDEDITSSILAQIIADQEAKGEHLLPDELLRQIIGFYEKGMSAGFNDYLRNSMQAYSENWTDLEKLGEIGRKNMEIFQESMATMFGGAPRPPEPEKTRPEPQPAPSEPEEPSEAMDDRIKALQEQLRTMQEQLDRLTKKDDK